MGRNISVLHFAGARPNFIKIAPVLRAFSTRHGVQSTLVHTGQHYDDPMSRSFFRDLMRIAYLIRFVVVMNVQP